MISVHNFSLDRNDNLVVKLMTVNVKSLCRNLKKIYIYEPGVLTNPGVGGVPDISIEFALLFCATSLLLDVDDDIVTFELL